MKVAGGARARGVVRIGELVMGGHEGLVGVAAVGVCWLTPHDAVVDVSDKHRNKEGRRWLMSDLMMLWLMCRTNIETKRAAGGRVAASAMNGMGSTVGSRSVARLYIARW
eukprot:CAMPEP_0197848950 /NCGR_PEP_ID=MMETSP1438-20131217/10556_1 /TAXON_ID=1461541 /ORGANISM="Pterosperma sp., Strain CCMP1384" /LENGTH=109 /DNA_ID=CAMNT_0043461433 /DNA_START=410 /DNA_END=736 /DNA_ORIENTATION=+